MRKKRLRTRITHFFLLLFLSAPFSIVAQVRTITGTVRNSSDSTPLQGVSVAVKNSTSIATQTNDAGVFTIKVPTSATTLVISSVGMHTLEADISNTSVVSTYLRVTNTSLNEVVVVGFGTQRKSLVTGAIASLKPKDLEDAGLMRADQALQGRVAGVTVMQNSGQPGSGVSIRVRGISSNGSTDPLYIVDGFPSYNALESVNPKDIESIEILKDAASSAIYGSRGGNGVIIVTTKKGRAGKMQISYDYYYGAQNLRKQVAVLNAQQYARIQNEAFFNSNQIMPFSENEIEKLDRGTNWQSEIAYRNAPIQNHQLSLSGGSENITFNSSLSYFEQDGIVAKGKSNFKRYTARLSSDQKFFDKAFSTGQSINIAQVYRSAITSNSGNAGPLVSALNMDPVTQVMNDDGTFAISRYIAQEIVNPIARIYYTNGSSSYTAGQGSIYGELKILKNLKVRSAVTDYLLYNEGNGYTPIYYLNATNYTVTSGASKSFSINNRIYLENLLTYANKIKAHSFSVLVGNTVEKGHSTDLSGSRSTLLYDDPAYAYVNLGVSSTATANGGAAHSGRVSYFTRANYDYDGRLLLAATFRRDGSYTFGPNNKFGYFPSVSIGWNISNEPFMRHYSWLNSLKLRASWGQVGSDINGGEYAYVSTISTFARNYYFGNDVQQIGASPSSIANPNLKWETSEQTNIGLDAIIFKNLSVTADVYSKKTIGLLVTPSIPTVAGNSAPVTNAGSVENNGVELTLGYRSSIGKVALDINANGSYNENKVLYVGNANGFISGADASNQLKTVTRFEAGLPAGYFWLYTMDGIFQTQAEINNYHSKAGQPIQPNAVPGDIRFKDLNNDGKIDDNDRSYVASPHPKFNYGLNVTAHWKGFDGNVFFNGLAGNKIFNSLHRWDLATANYPTSILDRWHGEGTTNTAPRVSTGDLNGNFSNPSTFFLEDGSFIRLKNISLGYSFKNLQRFRIQNLRFSVSATNVFVLTKYSGFDPEVSGSVLGQGIDHGAYPQPRVVYVGASVNF